MPHLILGNGAEEHVLDAAGSVEALLPWFSCSVSAISNTERKALMPSTLNVRETLLPLLAPGRP